MSAHQHLASGAFEQLGMHRGKGALSFLCVDLAKWGKVLLGVVILRALSATKC